MRFPIFLVAGVVCIVLGVAGSEWARRHPPEKVVAAVEPPPAALSPTELATTEPLPDLPADEEALRVSNAELSGFAKDALLPADFEVPEAKAILGGPLFARNALPHGNAMFLVTEEGKQGTKQTLLRVSPEGPKAMAVHRPGVVGIAASGTRLYWAEGGAVYSMDATTGGAAKGVVKFPKARLTSLGVSGEVLVAALVPKDQDLFSSAAEGAIVAVTLSNGRVKVLAGQQVRPTETRTDGKTAAWIAGYPADLWQASVEGGEAKLVSTRADGPVLFEAGALTFRHPIVGAPELLRIEEGGVSHVLAKGEIDHVTQGAGDVWFSLGTTVSHVDAKGLKETVVAKLPQPVIDLAITDDALFVVTRQESGGHLLVQLPRSTPLGRRP